MRYSKKTIKFRTPSLWANLPEEYKLANSLDIFRRKNKSCNVKHAPVGYAELFKKILVLSNFIYLFVVLFVLTAYCCSNVSSVPDIVERMNE